MSTLKRNERRRKGVDLDVAELQTAFRFLDPAGRGEINAQQLHERISMFFPALTLHDCKMLVGESDTINVERLQEMLAENELSDFSPLSEAFNVFDPTGTGRVDMQLVADVMVRLGLGPLSADDMEILLKAGDVDGDGAVSQADFGNMLNYDYHPPKLFPDFDELQAGRAGGRHGGAHAQQASAAAAAASATPAASKSKRDGDDSDVDGERDDDEDGGAGDDDDDDEGDDNASRDE